MCIRDRPYLTLEADRDLDETYESVVGDVIPVGGAGGSPALSLIHISEPTRPY